MMLIEKYEEQGLLFNTNYKADGSNGEQAYRGELVLIEGEIVDDKGRRKPPIAIMRHTVLLEKEGALVMLAGAIDHLELLESLVEKYKDDFSPELKAVIYVVDITKPMQLELAGINFVLIPMTEGVVWNELVDELCLEKSDFKGKSTGDKVVTVYDELAGYQPKFDVVGDFTGAMAFASSDIKREAWGAV